MPGVNCYFNGTYCQMDSVGIPISDLGFIHGATVTEQLRTLGGKPWNLDSHFARFQRGLDLLKIQLGDSFNDLESIVTRLLAESDHLQNGRDCGIGFFATPGSTQRFGQKISGPVLCVYCYPLPAHQFASLYSQGFQLSISRYQDVARESWPKDVKIRSRLHYYLADLSAEETETTAILVDAKGNFRDTSVAAPVFIFHPNRLTIPPADSILESVSLKYLLDLARELNFNVERREVSSGEIDNLRGMILTNSLFVMASVSQIENQKLDRQSAEFVKIQALFAQKTGTDLRSIPG